MKKRITLMSWALFFTIQSFAQLISWQWAKGSIGNAFTYSTDIATDHNGNVYVVGEFNNGVVTFGSTTWSDTATNVNVLFLIKYDAIGNLVWTKPVDRSSADICAITVDGLNNIYVTGTFKSAVSVFDTCHLINADVTGNSSDIFVAKYDTTGNLLWANRLGSAGNDAGLAITKDLHNNIYIAGYFTNQMVMGTDSLDGGTNSAAFILKYNPAGGIVWARTLGPNSAAHGNSVATDTSGNIYVTGYYLADTISFGDSTYANAYPLGLDFFIVKYDSAGNLKWGEIAGGPMDEIGHHVVVDVEGNIYVTGSFSSDSIKFGSYTLHNANSGIIQETLDVFLTKYNPTGDVLWAKRAGGIPNDAGYGITTDAYGNIFVTGMFNSSSITFDSTTLTKPDINQVDALFLVSFDSTGSVMCSQAFSCGGAYPNAVCVDGSGNTFISGTFTASPFAVGPDTLVNPNDTSIISLNLFIAKFKCENGAESNIETIKDAANILIYPNPFANCATVKYSPASDNYWTGSHEAILVIYDMLGRAQKSYQLCNEKGFITINSNNFSSGVYLYSLIVDGKILTTKRMVVE